MTDPHASKDTSPVCAGPKSQCRGLRLRGLGLSYNRHVAFSNVDLDIPACRTTAIVGPSGCGKSSLLSSLNRMDETVENTQRSGSIHVGMQNIHDRNVNVRELRRKIGMVFQRPIPFPLSIRKNLELVLAEHGMKSPTERRKETEHALRSVGLWEEVKNRLDTPATQLSGGQQQRLCLARVLALKPDILLLDEPCSALDPVATTLIEELIIGMRGYYTVVLVTHQHEQARRLADHVVVMEQGANGGFIKSTGGVALLNKHPIQLISADL